MTKVTSLVLSAGFSERMNAFKPLLLYNGQTFLFNILLKLSPVCNLVRVVTGHRAEELERHIWQQLDGKWSRETGQEESAWHSLPAKLEFTRNPNFADGMFTSLQRGVAGLKNVDWLLYHFVDQPHLPAAFYPAFVAQAVGSGADWIQPVYNHQPGHPLLLSRKIVRIIWQQNAGATLKQISRHPAIHKKYWDCDYPQVLEDFDKPEDLIKTGADYEHP